MENSGTSLAPAGVRSGDLITVYLAGGALAAGRFERWDDRGCYVTGQFVSGRKEWTGEGRLILLLYGQILAVVLEDGG